MIVSLKVAKSKDFGTYFENSLPIENLKRISDDILHCITLYNESGDSLLISMCGLANNDLYLKNRLKNSYNSTICIISDGCNEISTSSLKLINELNLLQGKKFHAEGFKVFDSMLSLSSIFDRFYAYTKNGVMSKHFWSIYKSSFDEFNHREQLSVNNSDKVRILLCIKDKNRGKLNSHWWFFNVLCKILHPSYCIQMDCGTVPQPDNLFHLCDFLDKNPKVGAIAPRVLVPSPKRKSNLLEYWQYGDFAAQKLLDWPAELVSGYLTVIPGQFCVFRWEALKDGSSNRSNLSKVDKPLESYFRGLGELNPFESNMFLAEDRILGFEIISRSDSSWKLAYEPNAVAVTDTCGSIIELLRQRRRWINSSFACNLWLIYKIINFLKNSGAGLKQKLNTIIAVPWLALNCLFQWLFPSIMIIVLVSINAGMNMDKAGELSLFIGKYSPQS
jgi:chitin synthase